MAKTYFLYGTMSSGKSLELIKTAYAYQAQNKSFIIGKSALDTRDSTKDIVSRIGVQYDIDFLIGPDDDAVTTLKDAIKIKEESFDDIHIVMIDEAQFLTPKQVDDLIYFVTDVLNLPIMFFGLKVDFKTHLFPGTKRILELAEEIKEIKATCKYCDSKATLNIRVHNNKPVYGGQTIEIGGNDRYQSVCKYHYYHFPEKDGK